MSFLDKKCKIYLASDHAGFALKEKVKEWLGKYDVLVEDQGAFSNDPEDDFPDFIKLAAAAVSLKSGESCALIFGGSGQGEAMLANRFFNVRATAYSAVDLEIIKLSREHNDANVLAIGARFVDFSSACEAIDLWLKTENNPNPKYARRNQKIEQITKELRLT